MRRSIRPSTAVVRASIVGTSVRHRLLNRRADAVQIVRQMGITGVGWHTFRHTAGTVLAELGEHQFTIHDYNSGATASVVFPGSKCTGRIA